ncbi:hypothetical protein ACO0K9_01940 [Undibacterium sp. Ji50W]|uniref:hypothetical protein n=1 Tax=Undibacterium sp. Ji50W TaxID=3413041 RepID=UPI003BEFC520
MGITDTTSSATLVYKNPVEKRTDTWLWFWLFSKGCSLTQDSYLAPDMREQITSALNSNPNFAQSSRTDQGRFLLLNERLAWITGEVRQIQWLLSRFFRITNYQIHMPPPRLEGRDLVIATIDTWNVDLTHKNNAVGQLERDWNQHTQNDRQFEWFKGDDENSRCALAWDWLKEKNNYALFGSTAPSNHESLLMLFDRLQKSDAEMKLIIDAIKKRWSQQQYRKKNNGKKQCNLLLSPEAFDSLDKLAMKYNLSRAQIVEVLIRLETERGAYLPEKMKAMKFEWRQMTSSDTQKSADATTNQ